MRWSRLSLRLRTTLVAAAALLLGLSLGCALLVTSLRRELIASLDDAALTRAGDAAAALDRGDEQSSVSRAGGESSSVQVLDRGGRVVAASPGLPDEGVVRRRTSHPSDIRVAGREFRVLARPAGPYLVVVLTPMDDVEESTRRLTTLLVAGAPVLLLTVCAAIWLLVGYTLHAVERLRVQVADLSATGLDRRVDLPEARDEVRRLAETMNQLLGRLEAASTTQRRFAADAAHELRSPLTAVRTRIEVNARLGDLHAWQEAVPGMLEGTDRLSSLVDDLLALARLDEAGPLPRRTSVDLDELVFAAVRNLRDVVPVALDVRGVGAGLVHGDPDLLARVVGNLLSNAVRYATTCVWITLQTTAEQVHLTVRDDGPGVPEQERERVFERFHRLDSARSRGRGGTGLGLAIVQEAVVAHGGRVSITDGAPGAAVHVVLPHDPS
ncbi:MAG: hypothetical protein JWM64_118 [Frankiales bacterium]|nr:hypothetical protein [Frankiales bacterium]